MKYVAIFCQLYRVSLILTDLKSILHESHVNMEISLISLNCLFNVNSLNFVLFCPCAAFESHPSASGKYHENRATFLNTINGAKRRDGCKLVHAYTSTYS